MANVAAAPKRRSWLRIIGGIFLALILLLIILYFVATSSAFFKSVILPQVSKSLNATVTVADAAIHPFSGITLHQVKVQTSGPEPLLTADEVHVAYHLGDILGGNYHVEDVTINSPLIEIITNPDGTSNLDPLLKQNQAKPSTKPSQPTKTSAPPKFDINKLALNNATVRLIKNYKGGGRDLTELSKVNIALSNVANGQTGKLTLGANVALDNHPPSPGTNAQLQATANGNFTFSLTPDAKPGVINGNLRFDVQHAGGSMNDLAGLAVNLDCDMSPTEIKQVVIRFLNSRATLGEVRLSGPFDVAKTEGHLKLETSQIDRQLLNLLGAKNGVDFGTTTLSSSTQIDLAKGGALITVAGQFNVGKLSLTRSQQTTPTLELHSDYQLTINRTENSALLQTFNLNGTQNQQPLLRAALTSPMSLAWGGGSNTMGDSALKFAVTNLNLADWKPFLGDTSAAGTVNVAMDLLSQRGGKQLNIDFNSQIANLTAKVGTNQIQNASFRLLSHVLQKPENQGVTGNLALADFTGQYANYSFQNYEVSMDFDATMSNRLLKINQATGAIQSGANAGGRFELTADYNEADKSGQLSLKLIDLNQYAVQPFVSSALGNKRLVSISVNSTTAAHYAAQGEASVKTDFHVVNLVVSDPKNQLPVSPLEARLQVDASLNKQVADVRQCLITLTPTERATNQLSLTGRLDMSQTNAIQGALKLTADSLDVTHYYDLFSAKSKAAKASSGTPTQTAVNAAPQANANTEPKAMSLPLKNFTVDASIARLYLHEVEITNFQMTAKIDANRALLKPFQLSLNGAPVNATIDLNLGVPGYQYDVAFTGTKIPVAPLADTFSPQYSGHAKGDLSVSAQIKGAGVTGTSMQKNLSGKFDLTFTNANIELAGTKAKALITPIAAALQLPELAQSPITWLTVSATIGNGNINLSPFKAVGSAFSATSQGTITIADVLTNSPINNLPLDLALPTQLAVKARLASANANNQAYVDLGKIATVSGTLGDPKTKVDLVTIGLLTSRVLGGSVGGTAGNILKGVGGLGGLLNGQSQSNTNAPATNAPSRNPFDLLRKVLPK